MSTFADEHEERAYRIICIIRYDGYGGQVNARDIKRVGDFLRGGPKVKPLPTLAKPLPQLPRLGLPRLPTLS